MVSFSYEGLVADVLDQWVRDTYLGKRDERAEALYGLGEATRDPDDFCFIEMAARIVGLTAREVLSGLLTRANREARTPAPARGGRRSRAIYLACEGGQMRLLECLSADDGTLTGLSERERAGAHAAIDALLLADAGAA